MKPTASWRNSRPSTGGTAGAARWSRACFARSTCPPAAASSTSAPGPAATSACSSGFGEVLGVEPSSIGAALGRGAWAARVLRARAEALPFLDAQLRAGDGARRPRAPPRRDRRPRRVPPRAPPRRRGRRPRPGVPPAVGPRGRHLPAPAPLPPGEIGRLLAAAGSISSTSATSTRCSCRWSPRSRSASASSCRQPGPGRARGRDSTPTSPRCRRPWSTAC